MKRVSIIVAVDRCFGIGKSGDIPWRIAEDMRRFRTITTGNAVIMGRRTWESMKQTPLTHRVNIVVSTTLSSVNGASIAHSFEDALRMADNNKVDKVFIIGGSSLYRQALESGLCDEVLMTHGNNGNSHVD